MRFKQIKPMNAKIKYRQYPQSSLTDAYIAVKEKHFSVSKASLVYKVPMQTLRDRVLGKINIDTVTTGRAPLLTLDEEAEVVNHLQTVAKLGYGYTRQKVVDIASDYAVKLGKRTRDNPLTLNWFVKFIGRWPELRVLKPRGLEIQRAKSTSVAVVSSYFEELNKILIKYNLKGKPHLIFNVDEKGITQDHTPPFIVAGRDFHPLAVTSGRAKTMTIIGCGSASGYAIPPFFVFAGKRMMPDLMKDATPGSSGTVSETGWSNSQVFEKYLKEHFMKFIPRRELNQHLLLLLDGHKSHVSVGLVEWAKSMNIILFILPAHTSHVLQPMDVSCYGPLQRIYHNECHKFMRQTTASITRYDVCNLAFKAYSKALSTENLHSAFKRTGIFPFDSSVINPDNTLPAGVFAPTEDEIMDDVPQIDQSPDIGNNAATRYPHEQPAECARDNRVQQDTVVPDESPSSIFSSRIDDLLNKNKGSTKKSRLHIGKIISGHPITETEIQTQIIHHNADQSKTKSPKKNVTSTKTGKIDEPNVAKCNRKSKGETSGKSLDGPSAFYVSESEDEDTDDDQVEENEKCCVCKQFTRKEIRNSMSLHFTKWAKCDGIECPHWVHLKYCTSVKIIRRGDKFYCPHCPEDLPDDD